MEQVQRHPQPSGHAPMSPSAVAQGRAFGSSGAAAPHTPEASARLSRPSYRFMAETATSGCPSSEFTRNSRCPAGRQTFHPSPAGHRGPRPGTGGPRPGTRPGTGNHRPVTGARPVPGRGRVPAGHPAGLPGRGTVTGAQNPAGQQPGECPAGPGRAGQDFWPTGHPRFGRAMGARPGRAGPVRPGTTSVNLITRYNFWLMVKLSTS